MYMNPMMPEGREPRPDMRPMGQIPGGMGGPMQGQMPGIMPGSMVSWPVQGQMPGTTEDQGALVKRLEGYMNDQISAAGFYRELDERATDQRIKAIIRHAMNDEQKHFRMLQQFYRSLTGREYAATPSKIPFSSLSDGLVKAAIDEVHAFAGYRDEYLKAQDPRTRSLWFELLTDEIEHATGFNTALHIEHMPNMMRQA